MDILRSRGKRGYEAFLESLEFYYPEHFTRLTGRQPAQRCSMILGNTLADVLPLHNISSRMQRNLINFWRCSVTYSMFLPWFKKVHVWSWSFSRSMEIHMILCWTEMPENCSFFFLFPDRKDLGNECHLEDHCMVQDHDQPGVCLFFIKEFWKQSAVEVCWFFKQCSSLGGFHLL